MLKSLIKTCLRHLGLEVRRVVPSQTLDHPALRDRDLYRPYFSPWFGEGDFQRYYQIAVPNTLVSREACHVIYTLLSQSLNLKGDVWECGVYKGGTAAMMAAILNEKRPSKRLHLFDTFEGMPETDAKKDWHKKGDFADTSLDAVTEYVGHHDLTLFHQGFMPETFGGLESSEIVFAHIDVDIYQSILDCLQFIWPRLAVGGFVVFDDYGLPTCPGARAAVDEFFAAQACVPLCLWTGQAVAFKSMAESTTLI